MMPDLVTLKVKQSKKSHENKQINLNKNKNTQKQNMRNIEKDNRKSRRRTRGLMDTNTEAIPSDAFVYRISFNLNN